MKKGLKMRQKLTLLSQRLALDLARAIQTSNSFEKQYQTTTTQINLLAERPCGILEKYGPRNYVRVNIKYYKSHKHIKY